VRPDGALTQDQQRRIHADLTAALSEHYGVIDSMREHLPTVKRAKSSSDEAEPRSTLTEELRREYRREIANSNSAWIAAVAGLRQEIAALRTARARRRLQPKQDPS
jgi:hypothetical protein